MSLRNIQQGPISAQYATGALLILDTPEAIAAAKARRLANLGHPYIPAAVIAAHPWPSSTCQPTTPEPIAAPAPASQAPAVKRANGQSSHIPTEIIDLETGKRVDWAEAQIAAGFAG